LTGGDPVSRCVPSSSHTYFRFPLPPRALHRSPQRFPCQTQRLATATASPSPPAFAGTTGLGTLSHNARPAFCVSTVIPSFGRRTAASQPSRHEPTPTFRSSSARSDFHLTEYTRRLLLSRFARLAPHKLHVSTWLDTSYRRTPLGPRSYWLRSKGAICVVTAFVPLSASGTLRTIHSCVLSQITTGAFTTVASERRTRRPEHAVG
jgi:hypothetical protein